MDDSTWMLLAAGLPAGTSTFGLSALGFVFFSPSPSPAPAERPASFAVWDFSHPRLLIDIGNLAATIRPAINVEYPTKVLCEDILLPVPPNKVDEELLARLAVDQAPETQTLEFKRALPDFDDAGRSEFFKDVCALANAEGGDIVFGMAEKGGAAFKIDPITNLASDAVQRRLRQLIDSNVEPRVSGLAMAACPVTGGHALVLRVPSSIDGPHGFRQGSAMRFVARAGTSTVDLTHSQLRSAFERSSSLAAQARSFRAQRLDFIRSGRTWKPLIADMPYVALHLVPTAAMAGRPLFDVRQLYEKGFDAFAGTGWGGASRTLNLEGLVVHPGHNPGPSPDYVQIFRTGALERVKYAGRLVDNRKIIPSYDVAKAIRESLQRFLAGCAANEIQGAAIAGVSLLRIEGYSFGLGTFGDFAFPDRNELILPEQWLDVLPPSTDIDEIARPLLDILWQCFNQPGCHYYEGDRWIG